MVVSKERTASLVLLVMFLCSYVSFVRWFCGVVTYKRRSTSADEHFDRPASAFAGRCTGSASENRTRLRGSLIGADLSIWLFTSDCFESRRLTMYALSDDRGTTK